MLPTSFDSSSDKIENVKLQDKIVNSWLHGKSEGTKRKYICYLNQFITFLNDKPLTHANIHDIEDWHDSLIVEGDSPATQSTKLAALKSFLRHGCRINYLVTDVGVTISLPKSKNKLAERILTESQVLSMIAQEPSDRNRLLLRFLYVSGARVSEVSGLTWKDIKANGDRGQVTLFGKGSETRVVLIPKGLYQELLSLRGEQNQDEVVFRSRKGGALQPNQIREIVAIAGKRAGIEGNVSPHWLRHSHASHSLDRGAPIQLVQNTLGHKSVAVTTRYLHARPGDGSSLYLPE